MLLGTTMKKGLLHTLLLAGSSLLMTQSLAAEEQDLGLTDFYKSPSVLFNEPSDMLNLSYAGDDLIQYEGEFGLLSFGQQTSVANQMAILAPGLAGSNLTQDRVFEFIALNSISTASSVRIGLENTDQKILYVTPRIAGLQMGLSLVPDKDDPDTLYALDGALLQDDGLNVCGAEFCDRLDPELERAMELGLAYSATSERGVSYDMSATYLTGEQDSRMVRAIDDPEAWTVGANIGYAGFTFGGSYQESDNILGEGAAYESWDVGASYERGPWGFTLSYAEDECVACDVTATDLSGATSAVQGGVDYTFGKNVSFGGGLQYKENETVTDDEDSAVIYLETMISF